jgi:hypothetical protein
MRLAELRGDTEGQRNLLGQRRDILLGQRAGLQDLLSRATDPDQIEDLQRQLLENEIALEENTKAVQDMTTAIAPQGFSSRAWDWFRVAIFNGMGGLLPQYEIPSMAGGGYITRSGLFNLHAGERVIPKGTMGETNINVDIHQVRDRADPLEIASNISWAMRGLGR